MTVTTHTVTRDLPGVGPTDVTFNYLPGKPGRRFSDDLEVLKAVPVNGSKAPVTILELRDIAQEDLDDDGYDFACSVAKEQRGEN